MATFKEGNLVFTFQTNLVILEYDKSVFHQTIRVPLKKSGVDFVACRRKTPPPDFWLIEVKDFRVIRGAPGEKNVSELPRTIAAKMLDTIEGLKDAANRAVNNEERMVSGLAANATKVRVVLHLEPYEGTHTRLFPKNPSPANIMQKLKQLLDCLDSKPLVTSMATTGRSGVPWSVVATSTRS